MIQDIFNTLDIIWEWIKKVFKLLVPIRASIFSVFLLYFFFKINDQGEDVLRALVEDNFNTMKIQTILFFIMLLFFAGYIWYFARLMLNFKFYNDSDNDYFLFERTIRKYLPRLLGVLSFLIIISSLKDISGSKYFIIITTLLGLIFYFFVYIRLRCFTKPIKGTDKYRVYKKEFKSYKYLNRLDKIAIYTNLLLGIIFWSIFTIWVGAATTVGSAAIIVSATTVWIGVGAGLTYWALRKTFPVFTILFLAAVIFSSYNNNHKLKGIESNLYKNRPSLENAFKSKFKDLNISKKKPFFIITADGGGIRAAYWSSMVLSTLNNYNSNFSKRVFAISSVSGGSLGSGIFKSLLKDNVECKNKDAKELGNLAQCSDLILKKDYLSYPTAYLLYPDLIQRFLPVAIDRADRGRALEIGWEMGYKDVTKKDTLAENFFKNSSIELPYLFLNSTWVEGGKRIIMSNIKLDKNFPDAIDFFKLFKKDEKLSALIHNSARFSYVSPAGDIILNNKSWGHIVDGGYFENSGATTAIDILNGIQDIREKDLVPVVIALTNDPSIKRDCSIYKDNNCKKSQEFMNELLSPIRAMLNAREARGVGAKKELKSIVKLNGGIFIEFAICPSKEQPPLGWSLSKNSRLNMIKELKNKFKGLNNFDPLNIKDLKKLEERENCIKYIQ